MLQDVLNGRSDPNPTVIPMKYFTSICYQLGGKILLMPGYCAVTELKSSRVRPYNKHLDSKRIAECKMKFIYADGSSLPVIQF